MFIYYKTNKNIHIVSKSNNNRCDKGELLIIKNISVKWRSVKIAKTAI